MELRLTRKTLGPVATLGDLEIDGVFECHTLEDKVREVVGEPVALWKIGGETAIPAGRYRVIIDFSNRFQRLMPHVLEVPGFEGVRIHKGNTAADTEGCILVGKVESGSTAIAQSGVAFDAFFPKLQAALSAGDVWITILTAEGLS